MSACDAGPVANGGRRAIGAECEARSDVSAGGGGAESLPRWRSAFVLCAKG